MARISSFLYDSAPIRVRVRGGEIVWFMRDVAAALGIRVSRPARYSPPTRRACPGSSPPPRCGR